MRCYHTLALVLLGLLVAGCGSLTGPDVDVSFATVKSAYVQGDTVHATLSNRGDHAVPYDLCAPSLEKWDGLQWESAPYEYDWVCIAGFKSLAPDESAAAIVPLPATIGNGLYRLTTHVAGGSIEATPAFSVGEVIPAG